MRAEQRTATTKGTRLIGMRLNGMESINVWNKLSTDSVHASSVNVVKNRIDKYLVNAG